jgi:Tol biopolymer transport system component
VQNVDRDFIEPFPTDVGEAFNAHKQRSYATITVSSRFRVPAVTTEERITTPSGGLLSGDKLQVTNNNRFDDAPDYSPDGKRIAYQAFDGHELEIYTIKAGGGDKTDLTNNDNDSYDDFGPEYSPNGKRSSSRPTTTAQPGSPRSTSTGATRLKSPSATLTV